MNIFERNAKKIVVMGAVAASVSAIFVRLVHADPIAIGFYRLTFAVPFFAVTVFMRHREELKSITKKQLAGCMLGGLFLAGHYFTWFTAIGHTTVASAVVICNISPIIILIITALFLREKTNLKAVIGVVIALIGAAIITGGDYSFAGKAIFGDIMAFFGALFYALYFLAGRKMRKEINAAVYVFLVFSTCWLAFTIGMVATGTHFTGYSTKDYLYLFAFAMVCQIGAHAVFNWCLGHVSPLYISTIETGESIFASALAVLLFAEIPTAWQWIGGGITICGILYYNYHDIDNQKEEPPDRPGIE
ncbi:MAG TPA: DMT family transporter [Anaerovoracaceae bacterium]|nr:DMT family transporter [Anaerovoracaceae bacterium]